ncbi:MAG: C-GCAxxG-C-C family protein [Deltaproteobacteria bacterium]|nr:C-GCAxxG-C-C family protein [Deltaproteobacteria bacterium]
MLGEDLSFDIVMASKMAAPFGAGISRWGEVCGAVVGGAMALGFVFAPEKGEEKEKKEKLYTRVQAMLKEFEKNFGKLRCRELVHLNLLDPAERKKFQELGLRRQCSGYVSGNVEIVRQILKEK